MLSVMSIPVSGRVFEAGPTGARTKTHSHQTVVLVKISELRPSSVPSIPVSMLMLMLRMRQGSDVHSPLAPARGFHMAHHMRLPLLGRNAVPVE